MTADFATTGGFDAGRRAEVAKAFEILRGGGSAGVRFEERLQNGIQTTRGNARLKE